MSAFYNENDPKAAAWLRELIKAGLIAPGIVDERSISDLQPNDLKDFTQCHFFAGIGGWSYALRLAGWSDDKPVWTGSCPCQPLSCAGQRKGHADERHLWPAFYRLITERKPATVFGEQVASPDGLEWFSGIRADLEGAGYAVGGGDLPAAGVAAPHPRQRIYWVADAGGERVRAARPGENEQEARCSEGEKTERERIWSNSGSVCGMVHPNGSGSQPGRQTSAPNGHGRSAESASGDGGMVNAEGERRERRTNGEDGGRRQCPPGYSSPWSDYDICHFTGADAGKTRRIERGTFPLASGIPERMGLLRGYGNAIVPQVAAQFIQAAEEAMRASQ